MARTDEFRPDIEGMRAIALLLVLGYHAAIPGLRGGYTGVDVFFVISGFLITRLILREIEETGSIALPEFYARRARRLLPAAAGALVATVLVSAAVLPPLSVGDVANDGIAAALYAANLRFAFQATDYLQSELPPSPLLHYWSLGVEEQFYLFWPAFLLLVTSGRSRSAGGVVLPLAAIALVSFLAGVALTKVVAPWAFYSLPSRAWELAVGGLVVLGSRKFRPGRLLSTSIGGIGLALVCWSAVTFDRSTPFPGTAASLPVVGTALMLLAGLPGQPQGVGRVLAVAPLRFLGRISYSMYLWHWPMLSIPAAVSRAPLPLRVRVLLGLLVVPIATLSHRWLEEPIRRGRLVSGGARTTLRAAGALSVFAAVWCATAGIFGREKLIETGSPDLVPSLAEVRDDLPRIYKDGCHLSLQATRSSACIYGDVASDTTIVLLGDSHAAQWFPALERIALMRHWRLLSLTKSGCSAVDAPSWNNTLNRTYSECDGWRADVFARIAEVHARAVVISHSRRRAVAAASDAPAPEAGEALWGEALDRTLKRLRGAAGSVVLIGDTPRLSTDGPVCVSSHQHNTSACAAPLRAAGSPRAALERTVAEANGATFIDPAQWLCPARSCPAVAGRIIVFRDAHHMTATYARSLAVVLAASLPTDLDERPVPHL